MNMYLFHSYPSQHPYKLPTNVEERLLQRVPLKFNSYRNHQVVQYLCYTMELLQNLEQLLLPNQAVTILLMRLPIRQYLLMAGKHSYVIVARKCQMRGTNQVKVDAQVAF
jgi:hypothetical protein